MNIVRLLVFTAIFTTSCAPGELHPSLLEQGPEVDVDAGPPPDGEQAITSATPLPGCDRFPTVGQFEEKLVIPRCATAACHGTNGKPFAPDLKGLPIYPRLVGQKVQYTATTCDKESDVYLDPAGDPEQSYLVSKVRDTAPLCGSGRKGGARMPFLMAALTDSEVACFVSYARAVTGR